MTEEKLPRHDPQHPLPEELRKMPRDETVCKFCGVSYLIHNEIKALEEKLRATQKELQHHRGAVEREENLKQQLQALDAQLGAEKEANGKKELIISNLQMLQKQTEADMASVKANLATAEQNATESTRVLNRLKQKLCTYENNLPAAMNSIENFKYELSALHKVVQTYQESVSLDCKNLLLAVHGSCIHTKQEQEVMEEKVKQLHAQNQQLSEGNKELAIQIERLQNEMTSAQKQGQRADHLQEELHQRQSQVKSLQSQLELTHSECRKITMERDQSLSKVRNLTSQLEDLVSQSQSKDKACQQHTHKLQEELAGKTSQLIRLQGDLEELRQQHRQMQQEAEDRIRRNNLSQNETEEIKSALSRARGDLEAMKKEREMMVAAHQNQIQELRESFKQKMSQVDRWPSKLEEALKTERSRHQQEIAAFEAKLKENFVLELQIEKEKHQELLQKYVAEFKEKEAKMQSELRHGTSAQRDEIAALHKQLAESKARARETENTLRKEIEGLKNVIRDLEGRLGKLDTGNEMAMGELRNQVRERQAQLDEQAAVINRLEKEIAATKEEVQFLQDTVRRECEERFELTEALSEAREELLALKKPVGGYSSSSSANKNRSDSPHSIKSTSSRGSLGSRSEEMAVYRRSQLSNGTDAKTNPQGSNKSDSPKDSVSSNSVSVDYEGEKARTPGKLRGSSMTESRKRIAQAMGRR